MPSVDDVDDVLAQLAEATAGLTTGISALTDAEARKPSLLPNWTRGHVLTHLARNAEGGTRLLTWALTGEPSYEYPSVEERAAAIEAGAGRPAAVLVADVRATAEALAEAAAKLPPDAWQHQVTWTTGEQTPAALVVRSRLAEVLIHRVDLSLKFGTTSWPVPELTEAPAMTVVSSGWRRPARRHRSRTTSRAGARPSTPTANKPWVTHGRRPQANQQNRKPHF